MLKSGELVPKDKLMGRLLEGLKETGDRFMQVREREDGAVIVSKAGSRLDALSPPDEEGLKALVLARGMPWKDEYVDRSVAYFASDERVDGHGDIVRQSWLFDEFEKNSPMPYSHEWYAPPVGRIIDWRTIKRNEADYKGPALWLLGLFATKDDWEWADTIFRLVKARILVSGSVGFYPDKVIDVKDEAERNELGLGRWGLIFEDNHLLEYSPTTIPANAGAHSIASVLPGCKSMLLPQDITMIREMERMKAPTKDEWVHAEAMIIAIARSIWPNEEFRFHPDLDVPVTLLNPPCPRTLSGAVSMSKTSDEEQVELTTELESTEQQDLAGQLARVEQELAALTGQVAEQTQVLNDLRDGMETLQASRSGQVEANSTEHVDRTVRSLETLLANMKKLRP